MGQADGLTKLRNLRKERARMLTIQRERELGQAETPAAKPVKAEEGCGEGSGRKRLLAVKKVAAPKAAAKKPAAKKVSKG